ncbi:plasmid partitioning/stability family protein [Candidatus Fukatsuia symbiotica]|uniref:Plasmid stabilization protein n=1 Tax=Candidatus Fukatsuia symbiotica TaxID=1878942 RepID=A0A2U8I938_9GAMM|nr:plasmid partitioning/stability family protein [Candidatus Fukatsuia symbiotica]AWK15696.1 plasmid stabilization protein [Candidatus Fukatsuia symbiotica]MEA9446111.1 plasmid partitioning/stability family protein [Candidatus Fukatsuia symbiotica]
MDNKRKKITVYLHPDMYPQDKLTESFIENIPSQMKGNFYRQSIICGAVLSTIDPRIINLLSDFFSQKVSIESVMKIIEEVTGYQSTSIDMERLEKIISEKNYPISESTISIDHQKESALQNLRKLKL